MYGRQQTSSSSLGSVVCYAALTRTRFTFSSDDSDPTFIQTPISSGQQQQQQQQQPSYSKSSSAAFNMPAKLHAMVKNRTLVDVDTIRELEHGFEILEKFKQISRHFQVSNDYGCLLRLLRF
jgi:hypothetical protein